MSAGSGESGSRDAVLGAVRRFMGPGTAEPCIVDAHVRQVGTTAEGYPVFEVVCRVVGSRRQDTLRLVGRRVRLVKQPEPITIGDNCYTISIPTGSVGIITQVHGSLCAVGFVDTAIWLAPEHYELLPND